MNDTLTDLREQLFAALADVGRSETVADYEAAGARYNAVVAELRKRRIRLKDIA